MHLVQDSFIDAFKNLSTFKYESTFGSWLKRIVINKSINYLKVKRIPLVAIEEQEYWIPEKVEELVRNLTADNELMSALIAVVRQSLQFSVDSRAVQPVQPVHEGLMGEFGTKTDGLCVGNSPLFRH